MNHGRVVTIAVLVQQGTLDYLGRVLEKMPNIVVIGIAGPGDPFSAPDATLETLRLVRVRYPGMLLCVATKVWDFRLMRGRLPGWACP
jgi:nitrogen fixation protein NifB